MALNIIMPNQALLVSSIIFYLYTDPGLGKSSIAHTTDKPVVFDFDKGQHRVLPMQLRKNQAKKN